MEEKFSVFLLIYSNPRTPCGVRRCRKSGRSTYQYLNPRTPCGVRPPWMLKHRLRDVLKSTHSMWSATPRSCKSKNRAKNLNPRTPCGVRQKWTEYYLKPIVLKSTHSMWSATAILYRNIVFLHRLHLFFWTNCFVSKKYYCFFKSFPLSNRCESPRVFMFTSHSHFTA